MNHSGDIPAKSTWRSTNAIPSWSWRDCEGNTAEVEIYTAAEEVELTLNGRSLGRKQVINYLAAFTVPYTPGELSAAAYENGAEVGSNGLKSANGTLSLRIAAESRLEINRPVYIRVDITGENGIVEANADEELAIDVTGARLLAFGSACPKSERSYLEGVFPTHYGRAMAVIIPQDDNVKVHVRAASGIESRAEFDVSK